MKICLQDRQSEVSLFVPARIIFDVNVPSNAPSKTQEGAREGQEGPRTKDASEVDAALAIRQARSETHELKTHMPKPGEKIERLNVQEVSQKPVAPEVQQQAPNTGAEQQAQAPNTTPKAPQIAPQTPQSAPQAGAEAQKTQPSAPQNNADTGFKEFKESTMGAILGFFMGEESLKEAYEGKGFFGAILGALGIGAGSKAISALEKNPTAKGILDQVKSFINKLAGFLGFELFPTYNKLTQTDFAKLKPNTLIEQNCEFTTPVTLSLETKIVLHNDGKIAPTITAPSDADIQIEIGGEKKTLEKGKSITPEQNKDIVIPSGSIIPSGTRLSNGFKIEIVSSTVQ